ncbi:hypothetical protein [Caldicellulosiruptor morganii]|uniref:Uncharacterized protein n=1 Tax=Caldicellulosiruptor morganii TaxID=1387555 RepID=A0ABY7BPC1_9FIRM|nr:hypothetical protein [Caldicellulosiruptor morganii]WAM34288.1 hypothetical protein OTK00_000472 [Caldicellulosiruptor morganii]
MKLGIAVERFLGNEEFVIKPLPKSIEGNKLLLGTTIDYEGNVVIVLNPEYFKM